MPERSKVGRSRKAPVPWRLDCMMPRRSCQTVYGEHPVDGFDLLSISTVITNESLLGVSGTFVAGLRDGSPLTVDFHVHFHRNLVLAEALYPILGLVVHAVGGG